MGCYYLCFLLQLTGNSLTVCSFLSGGNLLAVLEMNEYVLIDLFNVFISSWKFIVLFLNLDHILYKFLSETGMENHIFRLTQNATLSDLSKQISVKFKIPHSEYWLSGPDGNKMENHEYKIEI